MRVPPAPPTALASGLIDRLTIGLQFFEDAITLDLDPSVVEMNLTEDQFFDYVRIFKKFEEWGGCRLHLRPGRLCSTPISLC